jgi:hypothetical protein
MGGANGDRGRGSGKQGLTSRLGAFALFCLQLALVLVVVFRFDIEGQNHFFAVLCLAAAGVVVHAWLPRRLRAGFFVLLSLASILLVLGWPNCGWAVGIGLVLVLLCRLPVPLIVRVALLVAVAIVLAVARLDYPSPFWPVLASMFMFRLIVYLYDARHERRPPPLAHALAYFFALPNVCFTLFPVLDFKTFRATYYDEDDYKIYQTGIGWIIRGIVHLLCYRVVKSYLLPSPSQLSDLPHLGLFFAATYALYLRVSGWFHIITGTLHLFGFNVPRTHHNYFLAASFTDIWRRINIYWKDFMTKVFFLPAFFGLRRFGDRAATMAAVLWVFVVTWFLHSYQVFWLLGDVPGGADLLKGAALWLSVALLVVVNMQFDLARAKRPQPREPGVGLGGAVVLSLRTVGMFVLVSLFWGMWAYTIPTLAAFVHVPTELDGRMATGALELLGLLLGVVAVGTLIQLVWNRWLRRGLLSLPATWRGSVGWHTAALLLLAAAGAPEVTEWFGPNAAELAATLRQDAHTPGEAARVVGGYYEEIANTHVQAGPWLGALSGKDDLPGLAAQYAAITRPADALLERELVPGWSGTLAGSPLTVNHLGMRDREDIPQQRPPNTCRIALVGSSIVLGYGVGDDQVFKVLLEDRLNAAARPGGPHYELLNFGAGMTGAIHRRALIDRKVLRFGPDALYYFAHQDELLTPPRHLAKLVAQGTPLPYPCLSEVLRRADVRPGMAWGDVSNRLQPFDRDIVVGLYRDLVAECRRRGTLAVWAYLPMPGITRVPARATGAISAAEEAGFVVVDLSDWPDGRAPADVMLGPKDFHANALGHRLIAERLFRALWQRPELLPPFARLGR